MQEMHGTVMHYPWGTMDAIPRILGVPRDGRPHAEYWLGTHPIAPARINDQPLDQLIADDPSLIGETAVTEFGGQLPFMVKILSARHALSLQAHPNAADAQAGYAREQAAGIPITHAERSYKDDHAKPELLVALTDFEILLGFRDPQETASLMHALGVSDELSSVIGPLEYRGGSAAIQEVFLDVLTLDNGRRDLVDRLLVAAVEHAEDDGEVGDMARLIIELDESFPGEPGIVASCLLNHVKVAPGQAVFVPPGTMHADLKGTGIEVLSNSDNVIRGGLTPKHIAVEELVSVVDFAPYQPEVLTGIEVDPGVWHYQSPFPEFDVWRMELSPERITTVPGDGAARITLLTRGNASMTDGAETLDLECGQAIFLSASEPTCTVTGDAEIFVTCPGIR